MGSSELVLGEIEGENRVINPGTGRQVGSVTEFCELFNTVRDMTPFSHRPYESWELAADMKSIFADSPPTLRCLPTRSLWHRIESYEGPELPRQTSIFGEVYMFVGMWKSPVDNRTQWINPYYCHDSCKPRPDESEFDDLIVDHLDVGSDPEVVCNHLGFETVDDLDVYVTEAFGAPWDVLVAPGVERRWNTIAISLEWGSDIEHIAYVEGLTPAEIRDGVKTASIPSGIPDISKFDYWGW